MDRPSTEHGERCHIFSMDALQLVRQSISPVSTPANGLRIHLRTSSDPTSKAGRKIGRRDRRAAAPGGAFSFPIWRSARGAPVEGLDNPISVAW